MTWRTSIGTLGLFAAACIAVGCATQSSDGELADGSIPTEGESAAEDSPSGSDELTVQTEDGSSPSQDSAPPLTVLTVDATTDGSTMAGDPAQGDGAQGDGAQGDSGPGSTAADSSAAGDQAGPTTSSVPTSPPLSITTTSTNPTSAPSTTTASTQPGTPTTLDEDDPNLIWVDIVLLGSLDASFEIVDSVRSGCDVDLSLYEPANYDAASDSELISFASGVIGCAVTDVVAGTTVDGNLAGVLNQAEMRCHAGVFLRVMADTDGGAPLMSPIEGPLPEGLWSATNAQAGSSCGLDQSQLTAVRAAYENPI